MHLRISLLDNKSGDNVSRICKESSRSVLALDVRRRIEHRSAGLSGASFLRIKFREIRPKDTAFIANLVTLNADDALERIAPDSKDRPRAASSEIEQQIRRGISQRIRFGGR